MPCDSFSKILAGQPWAWAGHDSKGDPRHRGGPAQPLLVVEGLRKHFPVRGGLLNRQIATVQAVDDVSFSVRKGETLGIAGGSGCGKSTTARLLMRLIEPDAGGVCSTAIPSAIVTASR